MSKVREYIHTLSAHVVALGVLKLLELTFGLVFAGAALTLLATWITRTAVSLQPYAWIVWTLVFSGGALLLLFLRARFARTMPSFPHLAFDYDVLEKHVIYEYNGQKPIRYTKRCTLRARHGGLSGYIDKYHWTGRGSIGIASAIAEHSFHERERRNIWQFYEIVFDHTLTKGEEIETELIWSLDDTAGTAVPFLSADIEEPTYRLTLEVHLNGTEGVRQVIGSTAISIGARSSYTATTLKLDHHQHARWVIRRPQLLHHYELNWKMPSLI